MKDDISFGDFKLSIKRLKDNGFVVLKIFNAYSNADPRRWSVLVDPGYHSVYITCFTNKEEPGEVLFEFDDILIISFHSFFVNGITDIIKELLIMI